MNRSASHIIFILSLILCSWTTVVAEAQAQTRQCISDSADFAVSFRLSKWNLDPAFGNNAAVLDSIGRFFTTIQNDSVYRLRQVFFTGGASPEGSLEVNRVLSERRALSMLEYLNRYVPLDQAESSVLSLGRDWEGVLRLAERDDAVPYREETIALLKSIAAEKRMTGIEPDQSLERLKRLRRGEPYIYLRRNIFPAVRASKIRISYDRILPPPRRCRPTA